MSSIFEHESHSAEFKKLQQEVQLKLQDYLGKNYADDVLPL